ncbi:hypothetical protein LSCM1_04049 [Leishmania martiniquensis]|uniref:Pseudouridylate synthase-like protein n=1 Tax=Leishmania martiniquensis TaxID=1580590 RepID=A0A836KKI9_9TRYP|nr:hypothetical protein LSCM1_04049 [Leishmania martiniquensis]
MKGKSARRRLDPRRITVGKAPKDHVHIGLCLLYSGSGYRGLQIQVHAPTCHTVEGVLLQALKDAGAIADVVRGRPAGEHHHFARSCRTDRGVHAIRNMVSLFVPKVVFEELGQVEGICEKLNRKLPSTIRVASVMRLSGNFIPRHCCNRRVYRYMLPLYALLPPSDTWTTVEKYYPGCLADAQVLAQEAVAAHHTQHGIPYVDLAKMNLDAPSADAQARPLSWLCDLRENTDLCNHILRTHFTGARRYHNFSVDIDSNRSGTSAKAIEPTEDEALRVIYRSEVCPRLFFFSCATSGGAADEAPVPLHGESWAEYDRNLRSYPPPMPAAADVSNGCGSADSATTAFSVASATPHVRLPPDVTVLPFLFFQIEGGSFLLNMIRKVVGSLLAVCRGASESVLKDALSPERRVTTPLAPGPYLYLAQSTYHGYDRSIGGADHGQPGRLTTVQASWDGAVGEAAEAFAFHKIAADIVDVDLNAMPPLDDILAARDRALEATRPHTAVEDAHLSEMKEYRPVLPTRIPWPASSEMTVFLRLLRVHNWNVRPIRLDPDCKALREVKNKKSCAARCEAAVASSMETEASKAGEVDVSDTSTTEATTKQAAIAADVASVAPSEEMGSGGVPEGGEDGWVYVADTPLEASAQRQAYFVSCWKRARLWEYGNAPRKTLTGGGDVGSEGDVGNSDDGVAPPPRNHRS